MSVKSVKVKKQSTEKAFREKIKKTIFPQIYDNEKSLEDKNLVPIKIIFSNNKTLHSKKKMAIRFELRILDSIADVFLYLNEKKSDMFYSVPSGRYCFNFYLDNKKNEIEMYYLFNGCKSPSVFKSITRQ